MREENALLAASVAHPDEDTPRRAFADWLDEHGQPERAAFIRLQVRQVTAEVRRNAGYRVGLREKTGAQVARFFMLI